MSKSYYFKNKKEIYNYILKMHKLPKGGVTIDEALRHIVANYDKEKEQVFVSYFSQSQDKNFLKKVSEGTIDKCFIFNREIIKEAYKKNAIGIIIWHTHPSGDTTPSKDDIRTMKTLYLSLRFADITMVDFVIVDNEGKFTSLKQRGDIAAIEKQIKKVIDIII